MKREFNWEPKIDFLNGLSSTIRWYKENSDWVNSVINQEYLTYYKKQYEY